MMAFLSQRGAVAAARACARGLLLVAICLVGLAIEPARGAQFVDVAPLHSPRSEHTATLLASGNLLVAGGYGAGNIIEAETYDAQTDTWASAGALTTTRYAHTATQLLPEQVLVTGGFGPGGIELSTERYDPATPEGTWIPAAPMFTARAYHTATLLPSGKVLVAGGFGTGSNFWLKQCELYNPTSNAWSPAASMITARTSHTATLLESGNVLVTGGSNGSYVATAERYNPADGGWHPAGSMATGRTAHAAVRLASGQVLVAGGNGSAGPLSSAELFDPVNNTWASTGSLATPRSQFEMTLLESGQVLATGGQNAAGYPANAELYDPASGTWSAAGDLSEARANHTATLLPSGDVLIVGGYDGGIVTRVERYTSQPLTTTTSITSMSPEPTVVGEEYVVNFDVTAEAGTPTGSVVVSDDHGASCGPVTLVAGAGSCALATTTDGVHNVTAVYTPADGAFEASSGNALHMVIEAETHLAIASHSPDPSIPSGEVTVTVDFGVTPPGAGNPAGAVFVSDDHNDDQCLIEQGSTQCVLTLTTRGEHTLTASYGGDGDFNPSTAQATHRVNQLPQAGNDNYAMLEDSVLTIPAAESVLLNDFDDDGDTLTVTSVGILPVGGIGGTVEMGADGSFVYTPLFNAAGIADFGYVVSDGLEENFGSVTIVVGAVNDPPEFVMGLSPVLPAGTIGDQSAADFARATVMGGSDEDGQSVLAWHLRTIDDPAGTLTATPSITLDGTLHFSLSGRGGIATVGVTVQDDGGTANGGQDTSIEQTFTISVARGADLSVTIDDGTAFASGGYPVVYLIGVANAGPDNALDARVRDLLPSNLVDATWTCTASGGASCATAGSGDIDDHVDLPSGASLIYELTATVLADPEMPVENSVLVTAPADTTDFNPANDSATDVDATGIFMDGFDIDPAGEDGPLTATRTQ